ncbi:ComF family protein [Motilimonas eburnea]|uniref:ComF family protein n=1 Tax=Motilimonas eburnea TaxID=1737488 RepID=UPI001E570171|nr:ComF family protein [Motilimonas eburnea]MCE2573529.1 ComF family protein [Motilimonas eburnea]
MFSIQKWVMLPQLFAHASQKLTHHGQQFLPFSCLLCQQGLTSGVVCPTCSKDLTQAYCRCLRCGLPLPSTQGNCGHCLAHPPQYDRLLACGLFCPPLNQVVFQLKYAKQPLFAKILGQRLACEVQQQTDFNQLSAEPLPELLLPVPLHPQKEHQRGFNQAQLIAQHCSRQLDIPTETRAIKRVKNTQSQTQLTRQQRQHNMRRAFKPVGSLQGIKHLAIIDDIVTTGATVNSLTKVVKQAGVKRVDVWCICRTPTTPSLF